MAYVILAIATLVIGTINALSVIDERVWMDRPVEWWRPAVWEGTSGIVLLALAWLPMLAIGRFPLSGPKGLRNLAIHAALTIPFSLVHVAAMVVLRHQAYALAGETYAFDEGWDPWLYEYRKDALSYALYAALFWLTGRLVHDSKAEPAPAPAPENIRIDEGQRLLRVPPASVLAIRSSGNYVEFILDDGRRPLMRTTLSALGAQLAGKGFVRTHRSWIVNASRVAEIVAEGSGDYGLALDDGTAVPLSRRYPEALAAVRRG